jgi:hypothetical protein
MVIDITQTPYNLTKLINSSSLGNLMQNIAPVMGGYYLGDAFLIIIFLVSFIYMKGLGKWYTQSCIMGALSLTLISALFLMSMGLIWAGMMWFIMFAWIALLFYLAMFEND